MVGRVGSLGKGVSFFWKMTWFFFVWDLEVATRRELRGPLGFSPFNRTEFTRLFMLCS